MKTAIRKFVACVILLTCQLDLYSQNISVAPEIDPFNLTSNQLATIQNNVNLFNGSVNLPLNLVNIPSVGGLSINVSLRYNSSNYAYQVPLWNLDAPTGILGLGWSMDVPKIVRNHKGTGNVHDDEYYLIEGGSPNKLILTSKTSTTKSFITTGYNFWIINYYPNLEKWEIIKENGVKYVYGDKNSQRNTVQWIVKWGNWIGNSSNTNAQQHLAHVWNLSQIINLQNKSVDFSYISQTRKVGTGLGLDQTEASYLSKVVEPLGRSLEFIYKDKQPNEFMEPHIENGRNKNDAYQEFYETKYLDKVEVLNSDQSLNHYFNLAYEFTGDGNTTKRLLSSIQKVNYTQSSFPKTSFEYGPFGLNRISTPTGAEIDYHYNTEGILINHSQADLRITAPSGYAEPIVKVGKDFVVVTWRQLSGGVHVNSDRNVKVFVYRWDGEWLEYEYSNSIGSVRRSDIQTSPWGPAIIKQDIEIKLEDDFFAILKPMYTGNNYKLHLFKKDPKNTSKWIVSTDIIDVGNGKPKLLSGDNFVAVGERHDSDLHTFIMNGDQWNHEVHGFSQPWKETVFYTSSTNYVLRHSTTSSDFVEIVYLNEMKEWVEKSFPNNPGMNTHPDKESYWHSSESFAAVMAEGGHEFIYNWDENFENVVITDTGVGYADNGPVVITGNSMVGLFGGNQMKVFRYTGTNWVSKLATGIQSPISYGNDNMFFSVGDYTDFYEFDPNSNVWKKKMSLSRLVDLGSHTDLLLDGLYPANNTFLYNQKGYSRTTAGKWEYIGPTPRYHVNSITRNSKKPSMVVNQNSYIVTDVGRDDDIRFYKNGEFGARFEYEGRININNDNNGSRVVGAKTVVSWLGTSDNINFEDVNTLKIHRVENDKIEGKVINHPVQKITISGIENPMNVYIKYDQATASSSNGLPRFNKVTIYQGSDNGVETPLGRTEYYFYNGLNSGEVSLSYPTKGGGNGNSHYSLLTGLPYAIKTYDASNDLLSSQLTTYKVFTKSVPAGTNSNSNVYFARPIELNLENEDIKSVTRFTLDDNTGLNKEIETAHIVDGTEINKTKVVHKYWWQEYNSSRSKNILSPIIQSKTIKDGVTLSSTVNVFNGGASNPSIYQSFEWKRTGSPDFSSWAAGSDPGNNWRSNVIYTAKDTYGRVEELKDAKGVYTTNGYDDDGRLVYSVYNARKNKVLFDDFEKNGNSTVSKTGRKSRSGAYSITLPSSGTYQLTYWKKNGTQAWQFINETISSNVSIGGSDVKIDQVRLMPVNARFTSNSYDEQGNLITNCGVNNEIIKYEYDKLNRLNLVRDHDNTIIEKHQTYLHNDFRRLGVYGQLDFGKVLLDESKTNVIKLVNEGFEDILISSISVPSGFSFNTWSGTLSPSQSIEIPITFNPVLEKSYNGSFIISSNATSGTDDLFLYGVGRAIREISVTYLDGGVEKAELNFGDVNINNTHTATIRVRNEGNRSLEVYDLDYPEPFTGPYEYAPVIISQLVTIDEEGVIIDEEDPEGSLLLIKKGTSMPTSFVVAPGSFYDLVIEFTPTETIAYSGVISVNCNSTEGINTINVQGEGKKIRTASFDSNIDFGVVNVGSTEIQNVVITNSGNYPLTISSLTGIADGYYYGWKNIMPEYTDPENPFNNPEEDVIDHNKLLKGEAIINPGYARTIEIRFTPDQPITYDGQITINGDFTSGNNKINITGRGRPTRIIRLVGDLDFGTIDPGNSTTRNITIYNDGNSNLTVNSITTPSGFQSSWSGAISPGGSQVVPVTFSPSSPIAYDGNLVVNSNKTGGTSSVPVSGQGRIKRIIALSGNMSFGDVSSNTNAYRTLKISNNGNSNLTINSISYPSNFYGWTSVSSSSTSSLAVPYNSNGLVLAPGADVDISVRFNSNDPQSYGGNIIVQSNKTSGGNSISTSANILPTRIIEMPNSVSVGTVNLNFTVTESVVISNTGNSTLNITGVRMPIGFSGGFRNIQDINDGTRPTYTDQVMILPGYSRSLEVKFTPTEPVEYSGMITIFSDKTSGSGSLTITGHGRKTRIIRLTGNLDFGTVEPGSTLSRNVGIVNDGNSPITINSISTPSGFSGNWSGTINPGTVKYVSIQFTPTTAGQYYSGTLSVSSNKTGGTHTIGISGQAGGTRVIALSGNLSFGQLARGATATRTLTIHNNGYSPLTVSGVRTPPGFSGNWSGTIAPGSSRNVTITFSPTENITYGGNVTVMSNSTSGTSSRSISGTGVTISNPPKPKPILPVGEQP
ncbi:choice-of-anchor D domain-containing protein [Fulvivirga lutea]|uniref:Choice-of-anchor D domain-containing protein n=1 Tax=Fulvivirga lutea TaxID=2810512 RepID=A0A974WJZ4_9BACT|nr:choice-of-anchor D domain-containing protein [Fulvivirga lutea]QSE99203.1 choice-of-anchor D domain-containing protein [Fulvivirga lutea]